MQNPSNSNTPQTVTIQQAMDIGVSHHRAGRVGEAEKIYREILKNYPNLPQPMHMLGVALYQTGRLDEGIAMLRRVLELVPEFPEALANLGQLLRESGKAAESLEVCRKAIALRPTMVEGYINQGIALQALGRTEEALASLQHAVQLAPGNGDAYSNLGNVLNAAGRVNEGIEAHRRAIALRPDNAEGFNNLAAALHGQGKIDEAIPLYQTALRLRPEYAEAMSNLGHAFQSKKRMEEALMWCSKGAQLQPRNPDAQNNLGNVLQELKRYSEATACFDKALTVNPNHADAINNLGNCYAETDQLDEAVKCYRRAIAVRPRFARAYGNLGTVLRRQRKIEESIEVSRKAVEMEPTLPEAYLNLGTALHAAHQFAKAKEACRKAIALKPDSPDAHKDLSLMLLLDGELDEGWREYEWRLRLADFLNNPKNFPKPSWDGSPLEGRTILLHAEQGLGDTIQFCRFVPKVEARGGKVLLEVQPELKSLMERIEILKQAKIVTRASGHAPATTGYDVHAPLMSLPLLVGETDWVRSQTLLNSPYIRADEALSRKWGEMLKGYDGLKVGISWAGSATNKNDRHRSMLLEQFGPLAREGVTFFSLQLGEPAKQSAKPPAGMKLVDLTSHIRDFVDTAAFVSQLDLVISVDTAVVHLAGAMGKPVWVMVLSTPDFRWLMSGESTPWYPSMRLFRQKTFGEWAPVTAQVSEELGKLVEARRGS